MQLTGNSGVPMGKRSKKRKIATDPPVSEKQRRAMFAAAAGKSTLGIPKKVGKEFVGDCFKAYALDEEAQEAGDWIVAGDGFNESDHPRAPDGKFGAGSGSAKVNPADLKKVGGKMGSNEGGTYESKSGEKFYVKKPQSKAHVANEMAAARLYKLAGVNTLGYVDAGEHHVATKLEKLDKKNIKDFTPAERKEAAKDFAIHAWLSNWDAAGLGGDNQGVLNGKVTTLDVGGSLRYRAQGGDKGAAFGDKVTEMKTLRDAGMNPDAARLFGKMRDSEIAESVKRVTSIGDDDIRKAAGDDKLADRLIARKKDLAATYGGMAKDAKKKLAQADVDYGKGEGYDSCGYCKHFSEPDGCELVKGKISPEGWCDRFEVATEAMMPLAMDRSLDGQTRPEGVPLAQDKASVRSYTVDGHLRIEVTPISKANVCPYLGEEIPDYELLGLDKKKVYKLLRDPAELEKAAASFNSLPLLRKHIPVSAADHAFDDVVGSTGTDAAFAYPFLMNSIVIWSKKDITGVETGEKRELSSAYRYRADMTPGVHDGAPYDGVMRDIVGNHVALVTEGRAGKDVLVGDSIHPSLQEIFKMAKSRTLSRKVAFAEGALAVYLQPKLAADAKLNIAPAFKGVTASNFRAKMGSVAASIAKMTTGKLAQDAKLDDLAQILLAIDEAKVEEPKAEDEWDDEKAEKAEDEMDDEEGAEDAEIDEEEEESDAEKAQEKPLPNKDKKRAKDKKAKDKKAKDESAEEEMDDDEEKAIDKKKGMDKHAMDAAIGIAVDAAVKGERKLQQSIFDARTKVRPYVGELSNLAFDSAIGVYQHAIKTYSGRDVSKVKDQSALETILDLMPKPGTEQSQGQNVYAMDEAATKSFFDRFPGAKNITVG